MDIEKLKNECVLRALSAYEEDGIAIFTMKDLSSFAKVDFLRTRLKALTLKGDVENITENGFYPQYKLNITFECPAFIFEEGLHINSKCVLLELFNTLKGEYVPMSNKELAKLLDSQDTPTKTKISKIEEHFGDTWYNVLNKHSSPVKRKISGTTKTELGIQHKRDDTKEYKCSICGESNPEMFYKGYKTVCKECKNKISYQKELEYKSDIENMPKILFERSRDSFLRRDTVSEHTITEEDIREILEKQQYKCKYSGVNLCYGKGKIFQPSIDRIDNSKGYTPDNICVVSWAINDAKNDLSMEDFKLMIVGTYNNINNF